MKIGVITRWYNEEFFSPFFLNHYQFADEIIIFLEESTNDKSREIISRYKNARIVICNTGEKLNDKLLSNLANEYLQYMDADWVIRADADEYTFPYDNLDPREVLSKAKGNVINTWYRWVYRHETENDLDPSQPTIWQRRHGGAYTIWSGMGDKYLKPTVVRPDCGIRWNPGDQSYQKNPKIKISNIQWDGVHWQTADCENWIKRNFKNESRLSDENIKNKWGVKNFTAEMIREECEKHLNDPQLF